MDVQELGTRIRLGHAALQASAERIGAEILHVKGYAVSPGLYRPERRSTDADILVRPAHLDALCNELLAHGREIVAHFDSGSAFHHAMTLHHPWWGAVDVHRLFPGLQLPPEEAFELLWSEREEYEIAHLPCSVPALRDQVLLIMIHAGRDGSRGRADMDYFCRVLSAQDYRDIAARAHRLHAEVALAAATGEIESFRDHPDYLLWKFLSEGGTRLDEWRARFRAARTWRGKARTLAGMAVVNTDHLAMKLGHRPSSGEVLDAWFRRIGAGAAESLDRAAALGRAAAARLRSGPADAAQDADRTSGTNREEDQR